MARIDPSDSSQNAGQVRLTRISEFGTSHTVPVVPTLQFIPEKVLATGRQALGALLESNMGPCAAIPSPWSVEIHPTSACCFDCVQCSYSVRNRDLRQISRRIMDELHEDLVDMGIQGLIYSGGGEPTGWTSEGQTLVNYLVRENSYLKAIATNGAYLERILLPAVIENVNLIQISLYGHTRETFLRSARVDLFDKVISNLRLLTELKKRSDRFPQVTAKILLNRETYCFAADAYDYYSKNFDFDLVVVRCADNYELGADVALTDEQRRCVVTDLQQHGLLDEHSARDLADIDTPALGSFPSRCWTIALGMNCLVRSDGSTYLATPHPQSPSNAIGNVNLDRLPALWNSPKHHEVIAFLNERYKEGLCPLAICRHHRYNLILENLIQQGTHEMDQATVPDRAMPWFL